MALLSAVALKYLKNISSTCNPETAAYPINHIFRAFCGRNHIEQNQLRWLCPKFSINCKNVYFSTIWAVFLLINLSNCFKCQAWLHVSCCQVLVLAIAITVFVCNNHFFLIQERGVEDSIQLNICYPIETSQGENGKIKSQGISQIYRFYCWRCYN